MSGMHRDRVISFQRKIQLAAAVLFNGYAAGFQNGRIFTGNSKAVCVPVLNCYSCPGALGACPIGALQTAVGGIGRHFPFYVLGLMMLFGVVLGRMSCGLLCPFGLVQDLLHKVPVPKLSIPGKTDRWARYIKYAVLVFAVLLFPVLAVVRNGSATPHFCKYICPAGTLGAGIPLFLSDPGVQKAAGVLFGWKIAVLMGILLASMFISRPFCRYLCPLGAFYSIFNRAGFFQVQLESAKCTGCGQCGKICPMGSEAVKNLGSPECIRCGRCKEVCPVHAVSFKIKRTCLPAQDQHE